MIFPYQVRFVAERFLKDALKDYPGTQRYILEKEKFDLWCRLCSERLNQLDLAGYVKSTWAANEFIKVAAREYAVAQLKKAGQKFDGGPDAA